MLLLTTIAQFIHFTFQEGALTMGITYQTYGECPYVKNNTFLGQEPENTPLPTYEDSRDRLPKPVWDGHDDVLACYDYAWKTAFGNLRKPKPGTGHVSNFIDTAFNGCLFMWDTSFITMYGRYASRAFNFQKSLDNMYSHQYPNGFICREIWEDERGESFHMYDPSSTGPNILAWSEWQYYEQTKDVERLRRVFDPILAYHLWMKENRTWRDGTYYSSGWGCGMDNMPRLQPGYNVMFSHGHMVWVDACIQAVISANYLVKMASVLGREDDVKELEQEAAYLTGFINEKLWDDNEAFYFDMWKDGSLNHVKTIGSYWALLADIVPEKRLEAFLAHLKNPAEFWRPHLIPSISADTKGYVPGGDYWRGSIWSPTNYMLLKGLAHVGEEKLAYDIAVNHLKNVVQVYNETGTLWENYAPEEITRGSHSRPNFVGWTGLSPIAILFEYVLGIRTDDESGKIVWHVNRTERHGIFDYPFGGGSVDLLCEARTEDERPQITVRSDKPVCVEVYWEKGSFTIQG